MISYGNRIPNLILDGALVDYDVLNERAIRAGAGLMFAVGFSTMWYTFLTKDFFWLTLVLPFFFFEFCIRVFLTPRRSPISLIAGLIVSNQKPERVGAIQKRFARGLGLVLASVMMILVFGMQYRGPWLLAICGTCLLFMWLESAVGLCVGCKIYYALRARGIVPDTGSRPACPGGVCAIPKKK